jgi:hypothetical protein
VAREFRVSRISIYRWRLAWRRKGATAFASFDRQTEVIEQGATGRSNDAADGTALEAVKAAQAEIATLHRKIGQQQLELDFFRRALRRVGDAQQASSTPGGATSTRSSKP